MPPTGAPERTAASVARWAWGSGRWREVSLFGVRETHLPGFEGATGWLNSEPLTPDDLRGKVVLVAPRPRHPAQPLHPTSRSSRDDDQPRPRPVIHGAQNARRRQGLPAPSAPVHRRPPLARRKRLRVRPNGHRWLERRRHARPI